MALFGIDSHSIFLLTAAAASVVGLIILIAVVKLNPVITLLVTSLALAVVAGMPMTKVIRSFETGVGGTLGHIAVIVGLGTMLGKMMAESGASDRIAYTLIRAFGEKNVPWAMMTIALIVGLPAFFEVAFVLLVPILYTVARRTNTSLVLAGIPMVAGLSVVHGLIPPHPAAMMAVTIFHADVGKSIFYGLLIGVPTAIIAGPLYAKLIAPHVRISSENPMADQLAGHEEGKNLPGFGISTLTIVLPVFLMLIGSWVDIVSPPGSRINSALKLLGNDDVALLIGAIFSFVTLGTMRGFSRETDSGFQQQVPGADGGDHAADWCWWRIRARTAGQRRVECDHHDCHAGTRTAAADGVDVGGNAKACDGLVDGVNGDGGEYCCASCGTHGRRPSGTAGDWDGSGRAHLFARK